MLSKTQTLASKIDLKSHEILHSSIPALNKFLESRIHYGQLCEWGAPWGQGVREVITSFLPSIPSVWKLWVHSDEKTIINAPAWEARGINMQRMRFAYCTAPLEELKPIFLDPFFKVIILDNPKLSYDDCAFLAQRARENQQAIFILRNYFLSNRKGNVWAKVRLNCWHDQLSDQFYIRPIRGLSPRQLCFKVRETSQ